MIVLWPAFVAACLIEMLVFASFDPHDMNLLGFRVEAERDAVYSIAFFAFWFVSSLVGLAVWSLTRSSPISPVPGSTPRADHPTSSGAPASAPDSRT